MGETDSAAGCVIPRVLFHAWPGSCFVRSVAGLMIWPVHACTDLQLYSQSLSMCTAARPLNMNRHGHRWIWRSGFECTARRHLQQLLSLKGRLCIDAGIWQQPTLPGRRLATDLEILAFRLRLRIVWVHLLRLRCRVSLL